MVRCALSGCRAAAQADAPLTLCTAHLLAAHDWVAREAGITDTLPSPCQLCGSRLGVRYPSGWLCAICEWKVGDLPDGEVAQPRVDVVYYIRFQQRIKIGTSANPRSRIASLAHEEVLAFERGNRRVEQRRHAQFARERIPGSEWFRVHPELSAHVARLAEGTIDPWDRYRLWVSQELALRG